MGDAGEKHGGHDDAGGSPLISTMTRSGWPGEVFRARACKQRCKAAIEAENGWSAGRTVPLAPSSHIASGAGGWTGDGTVVELEDPA